MMIIIMMFLGVLENILPFFFFFEFLVECDLSIPQVVFFCPYICQHILCHYIEAYVFLG